MEKSTQSKLSHWLKQQSKLAQRWLILTIALGFISSLLLVAQAGLIASILHKLIILHTDKHMLIWAFSALIALVAARALCTWGKEIASYRFGEAIRLHLRTQILNKLNQLGAATIGQKPAGVWVSLILEQVEDTQDFFARYLPQMALSVFIPLVILAVVFPTNWAAGVIFLITAPLVPLFMAFVGSKSADANRRNVKALQRLSGHFYDRLQAMTTIRLFARTQHETNTLKAASEIFRERTMEVLRVAFLSSAVLEFFTSISIALTAVYFGFSFIGDLNFGYYGASVTLFSAMFVLILAPEFYQPLRDLGTYYHAKQQAIAAAENIVEFLNSEADSPTLNGSTQLTGSLPILNDVEIVAKDLIVKSPQGDCLVGPLSFTLAKQSTTAIIGQSGAGKTSLINAILGFLPYEGSLSVNGFELASLNTAQWQNQISWVGQNPLLVYGSIWDNISLGKKEITEEKINSAAKQAFADEFINKLGLNYLISDRANGLSVGQAQRIALTRAIIQSGSLWVLDEPTASLDANSEQFVLKSLMEQTQNKTSLLVTHRLEQLKTSDQILILAKGQLIESGSYQQLINKKDGELNKLLKKQINQVQQDGEEPDA